MAPALASLAAALVALLLLRLHRALPLRFVERAAIRRSTIGAATIAFVVAALVALLASAQLAIAAGLLASLPLSLATARRDRIARSLRALTSALPRSHDPATVRARIHAQLARLAPASEPLRTTLRLEAARAFRRAGLTDDARSLLDAIEADGDASCDERLRFERAALALQGGDVEGADARLEGAEGDELRALRALSHAIQGGADQAIALAGGLETSALGEEASAILDAALAHAHASIGDDDAARKRLDRLAARRGEGGLGWALRPVGPATDSARERVFVSDTFRDPSRSLPRGC